MADEEKRGIVNFFLQPNLWKHHAVGGKTGGGIRNSILGILAERCIQGN